MRRWHFEASLALWGMIACLFLSTCAPASAQWQIQQNAIPLGRGPGSVGFASVLPAASGLCFMANGTSSAPTFQTCPGAGSGGSVTQIICGTGLSGGTITITGTCAVNYGTTSITAAAGNDSRIVGALQAASNLSDVANAATARTNLGAAPLASPTFTGDPKAPTPATGDNDTSIATSAFVKAQGYLTANQTITLSGDCSGSGATSIATTCTTSTYTPNGTSAVARGFAGKMQSFVDVKDYGAICNGSSANAAVDLAGIQAAVNYAVANGRSVRSPAGICYIPAGSSVTIADATVNMEIVGDGPGASIWKFTAASASPLLQINSVPAGLVANIAIRGMQFNGVTVGATDGSVGIAVTSGFELTFENLVIRFFNYGFTGSGMYTSSFKDVYISDNTFGMNLVANVERSSPNNISLYHSTISTNTGYGIYVGNGSQFNMYGGSIEYNGTTAGGAASYGVKFDDAGNQGPVAGNFYGVYFEGNGGTADIWGVSGTYSSVVGVYGSNFQRLDSTNYTTNNILLSGNNANHKLITSGSAYWSAGSYAPNAGRKYIALTNTTATAVSMQDWFFTTSPSETPAPTSKFSISDSSAFNSGALGLYAASGADTSIGVVENATGKWYSTYYDHNGANLYVVDLTASTFNILAQWNSTTGGAQGGLYLGGGTSTANTANYVLQLPNDAAKKAKANAWDTYSDGRVKPEQYRKPIANALDLALAMRPMAFRQYTSRVENGKIVLADAYADSVGYIAQNEIENAPWAVSRGDDANLWGMNYEKAAVVVHAAFQEYVHKTDAVISKLQRRLNRLEKRK